MVTILCIVLFAASLGATRIWLRDDWFNPLTAFFGVWTLNLALYELDRWLQVFNVRLSPLADSILSVSLISVFLGGGIGIMAGLLAAKEGPSDIDDVQLDRLQVIAALLFVVFVAGVAWRYAVTASTYGVLLENLSAIREAAYVGDIAAPTASRLMTLAGYLVILNLAVVVVFRPRAILLLLLIATVGLNFVSDLTVGVRGSTFNSALLVMTTALVALRVRQGRTRMSHFVTGAALGLTAVLLMTAMLYLRSDRSLTFIERFVVDNYVYTVGPIPALSHYFENPWPGDVPGQWTFAGVYQAIDSMLILLGGDRLLTPFQTYYAPITELGPFNVAPYVQYFYSVFGVAGVILLSGLVGVVAGYAFVIALRTKQIAALQLASVLMFLVIFSVRGVMTNGIMFWVCLAFIATQNVMLGRRGRDYSTAALRSGASG